MRHKHLFAALVLSLIAVGDAIAAAPWLANRSFTAEGNTYAPADFKAVRQTLEFDLAEKRIVGNAEVEFEATADGFAYFLLIPRVLSAKFEGAPVSIEYRPDPDNLNTFRVIPRKVSKGKTYRFSVEFLLETKHAKFEGGGFGFFSKMGDVGDGNYFEAYGPSSFEDDTHSLNLTVKVSGNENIPPHRVFANGVVTPVSRTEWSVQFPDYFTTSSFFIHATNTPLFVRTGTYRGLKREIHLVAYSRVSETTDEAFARLPVLFAELEETFGPYPHDGFIAYIGRDRGGMEYTGAAISSLWALGHELTHSWFARGVIPTDGRSGWIDEGIASWRDHEYFRAPALFTRGGTNLGSGSIFQRFAPENSYSDGRLLMSELDLLFAEKGGLRPLLKAFFLEWQGKNVTSEQFRVSLEKHSGVSLQRIFDRYVYGSQANFGRLLPIPIHQSSSGHPPPISEKEAHDLR